MKASKTAVEGFLKTKPFDRISVNSKIEISYILVIQSFDEGERLLREDELPAYVHLVISGSVRHLAKSNQDDELITIDKSGKGQLIGWVSLLRGEACETVHAIEPTKVLSVPAESFVQLCLNEDEFAKYFSRLHSVHENWRVLSRHLEQSAYQPRNIDEFLLEKIKYGINQNFNEEDTNNMKHEACRYISSNGESRDVGQEISKQTVMVRKNGYNMPIRILKMPENWLGSEETEVNKSKKQNINENNDEKEVLKVSSKDLEELGIISNEDFKDEDKYPIIKGRGMVNEGLAILEMICRQQKLPMRKELCKKLLKDQEKRGKILGIEGIGSLCEGLGCQHRLVL